MRDYQTLHWDINQSKGIFKIGKNNSIIFFQVTETFKCIYSILKTGKNNSTLLV